MLVLLHVLHLLLEFLRLPLDLVLPVLVVLLVWPGLARLQGDVVVELGVVDSFLDLGLVSLSFSLGLVKAVQLVLGLVLILLILSLGGHVEFMLHEF